LVKAVVVVGARTGLRVLTTVGLAIVNDEALGMLRTFRELNVLTELENEGV